MSFGYQGIEEMLKGGASVRHVHEMRGHASIVATQIYTHLVKSDL